MTRNKGIVMISALASVALLSGCSLFGSQEASTQIDPPPPLSAETMMDQIEEVGAAEGKFKPMLYYEDMDGYIVPLSIPIAYDGVDYAKTALEYMVKGGSSDGLLPEGFTALLPEGTKVLSIDIDKTDRTATVDFSKQFTQYEAKDERKILEGVTWALTNFPTVDYVELWVEGKRLTEMPVARTPLDEPLSRKFGINVEVAKGVQYNRSTPVTLYFMNQAADFDYYVPVTRMIELTEDVASATVAELVKGPLQPNKLEAVFMPSVKATSVMSDDNNLTVDFDPSIVADNSKIPAESLQAVILSLTETTAAKGVKITVEGKTQAVGTDDKNYGAKPVSRPNVVNRFEM
ncbi:GerMN domain-containing protein [Paenibacillus alkalitolerans]|uniref:GerMN domain-containing protein n=1 Tax=Paenibacillus alkalitolerans TaxID=2799335 RepID=UPI0018F6343C|nr:GerMN domain-containing protein [Paenibacillus alkalitolerans]